MIDTRVPRIAMGLAMLAAPLAGVVAAVALPTLTDNLSAEIAAIAAHQDRYYVYALSILLSSYLLVPAFLGVMALLRERAPRWSAVAGGLAVTGLLIAVGDAAVELVYWQMGAPPADRAQMVALADRYENTFGSALPYTIGALATLIGVLAVSVGLWRTRAVPRWAAVGLLAGSVVNVAGFTLESRPVLVGSYVVLLAAFLPMARQLFGGTPAAVAPRGAAAARAGAV